MNATSKTALAIAFAVVVVLLLWSGLRMITETTLSGGMMGSGVMDGTSWMWIPTALLVLVLGALFVWAIVEQKK